MSVTFELQIRFVLEMNEAIRLKQEVLTWLRHEGVDQVVESLIDGIEFPLVTQDAQDGSDESLEAFEPTFATGDDAAPVAVYDRDQTVLVALGDKLRQIFAEGVELIHTAITDESWSMAWDEEAEVIRTHCFVVLPPGAPSPETSLIPLYVHQGEAFGSGRHATTKVALEMLEQLYLSPVDKSADTLSSEGGTEPLGREAKVQISGSLDRGRMLDVGTGSGILLLAGARIGFRQLVGTEIDQAVLDEAQGNLAFNHVDAQLLLTSTPPRDRGVLYDLVAANILAPVLHDLMPKFAASLAQSGVLLLAGFVAKEEPGIVEVARKHGLTVRMRGECRGWVGLLLQLGEVF